MIDATQANLLATVDRIVAGESGEKLAVLIFDDGQQLVVNVDVLPAGILEKPQLVEISFKPDREETARRIRKVEQLQNQLFGERGPARWRGPRPAAGETRGVPLSLLSGFPARPRATTTGSCPVPSRSRYDDRGHSY